MQTHNDYPQTPQPEQLQKASINTGQLQFFI